MGVVNPAAGCPATAPWGAPVGTREPAGGGVGLLDPRLDEACFVGEESADPVGCEFRLRFDGLETDVHVAVNLLYCWVSLVEGG